MDHPQSGCHNNETPMKTTKKPDETTEDDDKNPSAISTTNSMDSPPPPSEEEQEEESFGPSTRNTGWRQLLNALPSSSKKIKPKPGESEWMRHLEQAAYELSVDPYRGMQTFDDDCVWRRLCVFSGTDNNNETTTDEPERLVREQAHCRCPTLILHTQKNWQQRQKKRKRTSTNSTVIGRRSSDLKVRYPCDYNPWCLASLGGALEDIIININVVDQTLLVRVWDWDDPTNSELYSARTRTLLQAVRCSICVNQQEISVYLQATLNDLVANAVQLEAGLQKIAALHEALIFRNPLTWDRKKNIDDDKKNRMELSMPPGIENLGATCYLNTIVQCLAQNRVFTEGILSWKRNGDNNRMNTILEHFQSILGKLQYGFAKSITTLEFSTALGLDHYEQQDPNEFSRLFLDRIHQSFKGTDLEYLLPHIFQGMVNYETVCLTCQASSNRKEEFMDVNLPIAKPGEKRANNKNNKSVLEYFVDINQQDADLQACLEEYLQEEVLEGDNQYFCSACNGKRNAVRKLTFCKVPPVLNVQLSRYVYNRTKHIKEKVRDKVLLPLDLTLEAPSKECDKGMEKHRFVLCAVMRHKGTSAYSGHYVAEAMDWLTGQWFEFNDDQVTILKDGPSCSYDPSKSIGSEKKDAAPAKGVKRKKKSDSTLEGSQDAYNMYYVEEEFLAQSVLESISDRKTSPTPTNASDEPTIVERLAMDRAEHFSNLSNLCAEDAKAADRLEQRRDLIRNQMFPRLEEVVAKEPDNSVWVAFEPFLRFISCTDRLDDLLKVPNDQPVLRHHQLLCQHDPPGLHPRVARKGKLLPKSVYDAYETALANERSMVTGSTKDTLISDCIIQPSENLFCQECCHAYQLELEKIFHKAQSLKTLYDALDPAKNSFSLEAGVDETWGHEYDRFAYIVSRKFITWFRNKVAALMKQHAKDVSDAKSVECEASLLHLSAENAAEGLDSLDISEFEERKLASDKNDEAIAIRVNGHIICPHGKFNAPKSISYKYFPFTVWREIKELFPNAVEIKRKRQGFSNDSDDGDIVDDDFECPECAVEVNAKNSLRTSIADLANYCRKINYPNWNDVLAEETPILEDHRKFRLLDRDEITTWRNFSNKVKINIDKKSGEPLQVIARSVLSPLAAFTPRSVATETDTLPSPRDTARLQFLSGVFRPIVCSQHGRPIFSALFKQESSDDGRKPTSLKDNICVLREDIYKDYLAGVVGVSGMLEQDDDQSEDVLEHISEGANFCTTWKIDSSFHPSFTLSRRGETASRNDTLAFYLPTDTMSILFSLDEEVCRDEECAESFAHWQKAEYEAKPSNQRGKIGPAISQNGGTEGPIAVDLNDSPSPSGKFRLRVFEVRPGSSLDASLSSLATCAGMPATEVDGDVLVRRSSRKRKSRYPVGVIDEEETFVVDLDANVAALRLLLFESVSKGSQFELDHDLRLIIFLKPTGKSEEPIVLDDTEPNDDSAFRKSLRVVDLSFDASSEKIRDLCQTALGHELSSAFDPSESVVLLRQTIPDTTASLAKDALFDHFIGLSNAIQPQSNGKKKSGRPEKGFSGTFLLSTSSDAHSQGENSDGGSEAPKETVDDIVKQGQSEATCESVPTPCTKEPISNVVKNGKKPESDIHDMSDFVEIVEQSPMSSQGRRTKGGSTTDAPQLMNGQSNLTMGVHKSTKSSKEDYFESEDDDGILEFRPFGSSTKRGTETAAASLTSVLMQSLTQNPDIGEDDGNEELFRAAAEMAIARHPKTNDVDRLIEATYHAYLQQKFA